MPDRRFLPTPLAALLLFVLYGWIEFEAFFIIGEAVGGLLTFIGIFVTAFIGLWLVRRLFVFLLADLQSSLLAGKPGTGPLLDGTGLLAGAILMLLPGYVTDLLGLICFLPGIRRVVGQYLFSRFGSGRMAGFMASRMNKSAARPGEQGPGPAASQIIDGHWQEKDRD